MTDAIFGERFYATREPAWHGLGQVFKKALKPSVALAQVGMDYKVQMQPLFSYPAKGVKVPSNRYAILREPTKDDPQWREFGTASNKYEIIQNTDLAALLDPIAELWPLETMGALHDGKTTFMTLKADNLDIEGDEVQGYFMVVDVKDGGTACKLVFTPVRVVCGNTLVSGLRQASVNISVQHTIGANAMLKARVSLVKNARASIDQTTKVFRELAAKKISQEAVVGMMSKVYPLPKLPKDAELIDYSQEDLGDILFQGVKDTMYAYNYYTEQAQKNQNIALDLNDKLNDEHPSLAGSLWHSYNAVVESADYRMGGKNPEASALFGARAREKKRAFKIAQSMLG